MSKKKKKLSKRIKYSQHDRQINPSALDRHHLCYQGRNWKKGYLKELRLHPYCVVIIPRATLHREIHETISNIVPPKDINAKDALFQLRMLEEHGAISLDDPIEKRLSVLIALFDCCEPETTLGFKKQLKIARRFYNSLS